jgi:hypothetical protein
VAKYAFREEIKKIIPKHKYNAKIYLWGAGYHLMKLVECYKSFACMDLLSDVDYVVDSDFEKQGTWIDGNQIISPDEIDFSNCVIFITVADNSSNDCIGMHCSSKGLIGRRDFYDSFYINTLWYEYVICRSMTYKNRHHGECCFIIGNGPSLTKEDLNKLNSLNIITFACNQIYKIYNQTNWRATYYVAADYYAVKNTQNVEAIEKTTKFLNLKYAEMIRGYKVQNAFYYIENDITLLLSHIAIPEISENLYNFCSGGTTTFTMIQLAFYMGFSDVYLLGVDNTFRFEKCFNGELVDNGVSTGGHFIENYLPINSHSGLYDAQFNYQINLAYRSSRLYANEKGINLRNATRGGKLEEVERVSFDSVIDMLGR